MRAELRSPKTILVPVDCSESSTSAARCADLIARRFNAKIVLLYVLEPIDHPFDLLEGAFDQRTREQAARDDLERIARRDFFAAKPELRVMEGDPAEQISGAVRALDADLIVMSTHGKGAFRRFLLGSVTAKVLNDVSVPVLTTTHTSEPGQNCRWVMGHVLCALALDQRSPAVIQTANMIATENDTELTVVHVPEGEDAGSASERLRKFVEEQNVRSAKLVVGQGSTATGVAKAARDAKADLVVIGRSLPGPLGRLRTQSYGIIRESPVPVLSI